jgi:sulfur-oxidizing protein SoxZ
MTDPIRIRARLRNGTVDMTVLMPHPMESGLRKDGAGGFYPAHYITNVSVMVGDRTVLQASMSMAVSQDPLLSFRFRGASVGDSVVVSWTDNLGERRSDRGVVS